MSYETKDQRDADRNVMVDAATARVIAGEFKRIADQVDTATGAVKEKQAEVLARLLAVEQKQARPRGDAGGGYNHSALRDLLEQSPELKAVAEGKSRRCVLELPSDFFSTKTIVSGSGLAIPEILPGIVSPVTRRLTVRALIPSVQTQAGSVQYTQETGYTNNAATVSETTLKPTSALTFVLKTTPVVVVAHFIKASNQVLSDTPQLLGYLEGRLRYGLQYAEELQLLKGSGVGSNLTGLMTAATAFSGSTSGTAIDVLRRAITQLESTEYTPTGIVLNPVDWEAIELLKNTLGNYIAGDPGEPVGPDPDSLWSMPIVSSNAMTAGTFLVADFPMAALLFDRMQPRLDIATESEDDFLHNLVVLREEERLGLAILRPGGLIKGTF